MLLLSLIIYLLLSLAALIFGLDALFGNRLYWLCALCLAAAALTYGGIFALTTYQPESRRTIRNLVRLKGVRWICIATALLVYLLFDRWTGQASIFILGMWILPIGLVSLVNGFGYDHLPRFLADEEIPGKLVTAPEMPSVEIPRDLLKNYTWTFNDSSYSVDLVIRQSVFKDYSARPRQHLSKWAQEYVTNGISGEIRELAYRLLRESKAADNLQQAGFILSFVQQIVSYTAETNEYPQYPIETLVRQAGDCEDYVILAAALLKVIGYKVALFILPGHAALGVAGAKELQGYALEHGDDLFYYCEMSAEGWKIGEMPDEHNGAAIEVLVVPDMLIASFAG